MYRELRNEKFVNNAPPPSGAQETGRCRKREVVMSDELQATSSMACHS